MTDERDPFDVEIGNLIRVRRETAGLSQGALARILGEGWHRPALSLIEAGRQAVRARELGVLADALGVPVVRLLPVKWRSR